MDQETLEEKAADWAGKLSETWERLINYEIVGQLIDRGTQEIKPRMFKVIASITQEDDREFQSSYGCCSRWARRHDKSLELNYVAPKLEDMAEELNRVRLWWDRIKRYRQ